MKTYIIEASFMKRIEGAYREEVELRVLVRYELTGNVLREELGGKHFT